MKISYVITVHNESDELNKLLEILVDSTQTEDEIIIIDDYSNKQTEEVICKWMNETLDWKGIYWYQRELGKDFSAQKNYGIEKSSGDYIFHIDADEYPHDILLQQLPQIIEINDVDLIWIPRVNTLEGMTEEHIKRWGWRVTENRWVNYPDYQARVFKRDENIKWTRPLHEYITGCKTYAHLPPHEELSLYHPKTIQKQEQQNLFYNENFSKEMNVRR
tara:strand:- start:772 stop:1425 length:654 start_codon:yes stop_codon:yes gene_type:complete